MTFSNLITGYLSQGTAASRPSAPSEDTSTLSLYFASDTKVLSMYDWIATAWRAFPGLIGSATPTGTNVVTFNNIPSSYSHLMLLASGRSTSGTLDNATLTLNNDSGANYDFGLTQLASSSVGPNGAVGQTSIQGGVIPGSGATASRAGNAQFTILNYADTTLDKTVIVAGGGMSGTTLGSIVAQSGFGGWRSTAAVTRVDLTLSAGNWDTGSRVSLYGLP